MPLVEKVEAEEEAPELAMEKLFEGPEAAEMEVPGDFSGASEGKVEPVLRIDWGDLRTALTIIKNGGMRLVVYEGMSSPIDAEYILHEGQWVKQRLRVGRRERFSNRLRIVHDVPAFASVIGDKDWKEGDQLAVMLPRQVEQLLLKAQMIAASSKGLTMSGVHSFAGKFYVVDDNRLNFEVTAIHVRTQ